MHCRVSCQSHDSCYLPSGRRAVEQHPRVEETMSTANLDFRGRALVRLNDWARSEGKILRSPAVASMMCSAERATGTSRVVAIRLRVAFGCERGRGRAASVPCGVLLPAVAPRSETIGRHARGH